MRVADTIPRWFLVGAVAALALLASPAHAQKATKQVANAKKFAAEHKLPTRKVKAGPAKRKVTRLFVPVLPEQFAEFTDAMSKGADGAVVYFDGDTHNSMAIESGNSYLWGQSQGADDYYFRHAPRTGRIMAVEPTSIDHLRRVLKKNDEAPKCYNGNCMEWLPNVETGPGTMFFHDLGIKRSKDGPNMKAKMLHGANKRLQVIGVPVDSIEQFNEMTDDELLGPPPAAGVEEAIKE